MEILILTYIFLGYLVALGVAVWHVAMGSRAHRTVTAALIAWVTWPVAAVVYWRLR